MKCCCLCTSDLSKSKGQTHRKRTDDSVLCYECLQVLKKLVANEKEAAQFKQKLSYLLQRFVNNVGGSRKRTVQPESQTPRPKKLSSQPKRITDPSQVTVCEAI